MLHPIHFFLEPALFLVVPEVVGVDTFLTGSLETGHQGVFFLEQVFGDE